MAFEYFAAMGSTLLMDNLTDSDTIMKAAPDYYGPRFQAIADLRAIDDGTLHKGNEFRRVASLVNVPLMTAMRLVEPNFFKERKLFYDWLDRGQNRRYCTYDRRRRTEKGDGLFHGFKEKEAPSE